MEILDTTKINYHLEDIIQEASKELIFISPYIKINNKLLDIILEKSKTDIYLTLVFGKESKLDDELLDKLKTFKNLSIFHCKDLHAKIYINDNSCLITSMNLYDYSQINNYEVGTLIEKEKSLEQYSDTLTLVNRIIKGSESYYSSIKSNSKTFNYNKIPIPTIAKNLNVSDADIIEVFKNNGLITKESTYWKITQKGKERGGEVRFSKQYGYFNVWPHDIIEINQ